MLRCFGALEVPGAFQPFKSILRSIACDKDTSWLIPSVDTLVIKESFGPYFAEECTYDPVTMLQRLGIGPDRISYVCVVRDPRQAAASWQRSFADRDGLPALSASGFDAAYTHAVALATAAQTQGIDTQVIRLEELMFGNESKVLRSLMKRLRLDSSIDPADWQHTPLYGEPGSSIVKLPQPDRFRAPIMDQVKGSPRFSYQESPVDRPRWFDEVTAQRSARQYSRARMLSAVESREIGWTAER